MRITLSNQRAVLPRWFSRAAAAAIELVYPAQCASCRCDLEPPADGVLLCIACRKQLALPRNACKRCGAATGEKLVDSATSSTEHVNGIVANASCRHCRDSDFAFESVIALGDYRDELREVVLRMKSPSGEPLAAAMGRLLALERRQLLEQFAPTQVVAVPMHWTRRVARGTNSPEFLAAAIGHALAVRVAWRGLVRRRRTAHQNELLPEDRSGNVAGAFRIGFGRNLRGTRVLLVDDVLTTGSTASEAARTVRRAGAAAVAIAVIARATH